MKKKNTSGKHSLFVQYLLLYLIVAFVPATISCFSLFFSYQALEEEVVRSNQASVKLIQQSLDTKIQELESFLLGLEEDPSLTRQALQKDPITAIASLNNATSLQNTLSNIVIHIKNTDYSYSAHGGYYTSNLEHQSFMKNLIQHGYSYQEWLDLLDSVTTPTYWPVNDIANTLDNLYMFVPMGSAFQHANQHSSRTVVFFIKQDYIKDLFRSSQTNMEENILFLNSDMELLSHLVTNTTDASVLEVCEYLKTHLIPNEASTWVLTYKDNLIFASQSQETGFYYVRYLPESAVYETIHIVRTYTVIIMVFVVAIGVLLIIFGMRHSYAPIRSLADWIRSNQTEVTDIPNELSLFKQVFDDTFEKNASLTQTIEASQQGLTDHLLTALIRGNFSTEEAFRNACTNLNIQLNRTWYCVCNVTIEDDERSSRKTVSFEKLLETIHDVLPDGLLLQAKDLLFAGKFLLLLNSDSDDPAFYQDSMTAIKNQLLEMTGLHTSIGMGSCYDSYEMIGKSYLESVNALDYRLIYGKERLITPEMYSSNEYEDSYPTADLNLLYSALLSQDMDMVTDAIHRINAYAKSKSCSLHTAKYICYDAFSVLKKIPTFINVGYANALSQTLNITHLTNFDTVDDFFASLLDIAHHVIGSETARTTSDNSDIIQQVVDYINDHCFCYDFQISSMAEHFSFSPQYMRKLFKKHMGIGLSDYISNLKLEKAMQLLRDTDMNLQDIVLEIGNADVSGFVRSFKQKTGMTPGQYRKANNQEV